MIEKSDLFLYFGVGCMVAGIAMIYIPAGLIAAGLCSIGFAYLSATGKKQDV